MGYTTNFYGHFDIDPPLDAGQVQTLVQFARERHEGREFPGIICQWIPSLDGAKLHWDGNEKFYDYVEWLKFLIERFLKPWGRQVDGEVAWEGEEHGDRGKLVVRNNIVFVRRGVVKTEYGPPEEV